MYLDPGFGSMIIQLVVALFAGAGAILLVAKNKVKNIFKKKDKNEQTPEENSDDSVYTVEE